MFDPCNLSQAFGSKPIQLSELSLTEASHVQAIQQLTHHASVKHLKLAIFRNTGMRPDFAKVSKSDLAAPSLAFSSVPIRQAC